MISYTNVDNGNQSLMNAKLMGVMLDQHSFTNHNMSALNAIESDKSMNKGRYASDKNVFSTYLKLFILVNE